MKLLANAHVSRMMVEFLLQEGHDCVHTDVIQPGMTDQAILKLAVEERRIIITADKDFGELVFRRLVPAVGVILLRLRASSEQERMMLLRKNWPSIASCVEGHFVVVNNRSVRRTPLPAI